MMKMLKKKVMKILASNNYGVLIVARLLYQTWHLMWFSQQLWEGRMHYSHFEDEKTETHRDKVTFPKSQNS